MVRLLPLLSALVIACVPEETADPKVRDTAAADADTDADGDSDADTDTDANLDTILPGTIVASRSRTVEIDETSAMNVRVVLIDGEPAYASTNASDSFGYYALLPAARRVTRLPLTPWTEAVSEPDKFWEESLEAVTGPDGSVVVLMEPAYNTSYPWVGFGIAPATGEGTSAFLGYGVEDARTYGWSDAGEPFFVWSQTSDDDPQDGVFFARGGDPEALVASATRVLKEKTLYNAGYDGEYVFNVGYDDGCEVFYLTTWSATGEEQAGACLIEGDTGMTWYGVKVASGGFGRAAALISTRDDSVEAPWFVEFDVATGVLDAEPMDLAGLVDAKDLASGYTDWVLTAGHGGWVLTWVNVDDGRTVNLLWIRRGEAPMVVETGLVADNYDEPAHVVATETGFHVAVGGSNITAVDLKFE